MKITENELKGLLTELGRKTNIVSLEIETVPPMNKTGNDYYGRVTKVAKLNALIGSWSYGKSVNNRRDKEGLDREFVPEPRRWGKRVPNTPFVEHNGILYVELYVLDCLLTTYMLDGKMMPHDDLKNVKEFLRERGEEGRRQGVDNPVIVRDVKLGNIRKLRMSKTEYEIFSN